MWSRRRIILFIKDLLGLTPVLSSFNIDNINLDRVNFVASNDVTGLTTTGFVVSGHTINSVTINSGGLSGYFVVSSAFDIFQRGRTIALSSNNVVYAFTRQSIANNIEEPTPTRTVWSTVMGSGANDGTSEVDSFTFGQAIADATAGDLINVKVGDYGDTSFITASNGTAVLPIVLQGYKVTPGDITSMYWNSYADTIDTAQMPYFNHGDRTTGDWGKSNLSKQYWIVRNFQAEEFEKGIRIDNGSNYIFERCLFNKIGDPDENAINGFGAQLRYDNNSLLDCRISNSTGDGIKLWKDTNYNLIKDTKVFCNESLETGLHASTDYYIVLAGKSSVVKDCYIERVGDLEHSGHGYAFKEVDNVSMVENNLVENSTVVNIKQAVEFKRQNQNNVIRKITFLDDPTHSGFTNGGIKFNDSSLNDIVEDCYFDSVNDSAIDVLVSYGNPVGLKISNSIFKGVTSIVGDSANANGLEFSNCTFYNIPNVGSSLDNTNSFTNCIFDTIATNGSSAVFDYNNFYNGFAATGTHQYTLNPNFVDTTDFVPQETGLIIAPKISGVEYDYNDDERVSTTTIGAVKNTSE